MNNQIINDMYTYAIENEVPIIKDDGLKVLLEIIDKYKPKKILEIGTAIGYSSCKMALASDCVIDTIERNPEMYKMACENISKLGLNSRVRLFFCDALLIDNQQLCDDYDLLFVDAAKAQNIKFFEKFGPLLKTKGVIFTDNILFHGFVTKYENNEFIASRDLRGLVRKISNFNKWLKNNEEYETTFLSIGDGIAISVKK